MHAPRLSTVVTLLFCVLDTWKIKLNLSDLSQYMYKNMIAEWLLFLRWLRKIVEYPLNNQIPFEK